MQNSLVIKINVTYKRILIYLLLFLLIITYNVQIVKANAPTVTTNDATNIEETTATLNGAVSDVYQMASERFEYGLTTSYGSTIDIAPTQTADYIRPNAAGDLTQFTPNNAPTNWDCVDEATADDMATFVSYNGSVQTRDLYHLQNTPPLAEPIAIDRIVIYPRWYGFGSGSARVIIKTGGTVYTSSSYTLPVLTWGSQAYVLDTNPKTGTYWRYADINSLQAGIQCDGGLPVVMYCTQIYIRIIYNHFSSPFSKAISSLTPGKLYHFRAVAENYNGTYYGSDKIFLTKPQAPTTLKTMTIDTTKIELTWLKGTGANNTRIQRSTTGYPSNINDGTNVYNGTGTNYMDTGLILGQTYYYRAWSYSHWSTRKQWSDGYASAYNITNHPPNLPSNPVPNTGANNININSDLSWTGGDPDTGDTVAYEVYFGTSGSPPKVSNNQSETTYDTGAMNYNTTYYWKIVACDNHGDTTTSPLWNFVTQQPLNNPPYEPNTPVPADKTTDVDSSTLLSWMSGDPDPGDIVTYDIHFGTSSNPPLIKSSHTTTSYHPGTLNADTKYYWKIVAKDNHGASTTGSVWYFTTRLGSPLIADVGGPYSGTLNEPIDFLGNASGGVPPYQYHWDFGDSNTSTQQNPQHTYNRQGNYTITLSVQDDANTFDTATTYAVISDTGIGIPVIDTIQGGFGISADIKNNGSADCSNLSWSIAISGGLISSGDFTQGTIEMLSVDETETIQASRLRGIGFITITVQVGEESKQASGFLLGRLVLRVTQH